MLGPYYRPFREFVNTFQEIGKGAPKEAPSLVDLLITTSTELEQ